MIIETLSKKQKQILQFVNSDEYALVCDGSVRSGKTTIMSIAFLLWAMSHYDRTNFAICGKTVQSAERNVLKPLMEQQGLRAAFTMRYRMSNRVLTVRCGEKENWFYLFGGKDESSYMLIQGITLAGVFFDEVALMPRSFVEQALSRAISYEKPKYFFNCNPESPTHYFYKEWIEKPRENVKHLHFLLEDNPILTPQMIERTKAMYSGVFYDRYIRGLWVMAEGLIYSNYNNTVPTEPRKYTRYYITMDYGTLNPTAMLLWGYCDGVWYCVNEFYHSGRETNSQKTDEEYYEDLKQLAAGLPIRSVIIDPSAASFITLVEKRHDFPVWDADNAVLDGIREVASCLQLGLIKINDCCKRTIEEFGLYRWDDKAPDDKPIKDNDHAMDALRYFVKTVGVLQQKKQQTIPWMYH